MNSERYFIPGDDLQQLLDSLQDEGYTCIGPQVRDGAIIYDNIESIEELPRGVNDTQSPGVYSLTNSESTRYFDWANGPQALKPLLFTAKENLWQSHESEGGKLTFDDVEPEITPVAVIGARACDIAAMKIHDQHFLQQEYIDPYYRTRREALLIIAVNCACPSASCFCHSTGDGPFVRDGADIVLTELTAGFLVEAASDRGRTIIQALVLQDCSKEHLQESAAIEKKSSNQQRELPQVDIKSRLFEELDNEAWHAIAATCLSCGNCTSVCPTCFCHSEKDIAQLDGKSTVHVREWDSCFGETHSYIHGITIRSQTSQRYRQWLTHKFSSWYEQYGRSGCVGCGRCITWCPVGIDVVESVTQVVMEKNA